MENENADAIYLRHLQDVHDEIAEALNALQKIVERIKTPVGNGADEADLVPMVQRLRRIKNFGFDRLIENGELNPPYPWNYREHRARDLLIFREAFSASGLKGSQVDKAIGYSKQSVHEASAIFLVEYPITSLIFSLGNRSQFQNIWPSSRAYVSQHDIDIPELGRLLSEEFAAAKVRLIGQNAHETDSDSAEPQTLGSAEVAAMLFIGTKSVARVAREKPAEVGAEKDSSGAWRFNRSRVVQYAIDHPRRDRPASDSDRSRRPVQSWICEEGHPTRSIAKPHRCKHQGCLATLFVLDAN